MQAIARQSALALERALLYEREHQAVRARDEVLGVVAHDLRNPLGAINLYAHLAEDSLPESERHNARSIYALVEQVSRLIQDLLDVSRLEAGQLRVEPQPVLPADLFKIAADMFGLNAASQGITLAIELAGEPPLVMADPGRIDQVLSNLVGNALRFTARGGRITLRAAPQQNEVVFTVLDTGTGIAPEHLPHLFDRFWQAEKTSRAGAGLGLAIARGIVEAHRGRIWVESEEGSGSAFHFTLPCAGPAAPVVAHGDTARAPEPLEVLPPSSPERDHLRVVLADDHPVVRRGITGFLRKISSLVELVGEASSGEEAVELAERLRPDVVLMDVEMPGMGGIAATRRIREIDRGIRVIALTADAQEEILIPVLRAGGSGFIRKSEAHQELIPAMRAAARHEAVLPPGGVDLLIEGYHSSEGAEAESPLRYLSPQDREILRMAAEGFTSREIGRKLFLSHYTVDSYRSELMRRLGLTHRPELVKFAVSTGLLADG
jgi:DNA-binding NarL/FixJ family response regulator/anti-sigma regulatory factor (Ser/Thr protein kinase)